MKKITLLISLLISSLSYALDDIPANFVKSGIGYFDQPVTNNVKLLQAEQQSSPYDKYISYLLKLDNYPKQVNLMPSPEITDPRDTHMRPTLKYMRLNFPFHFTLTKNIIGFAPEGTWKNEGWTGVKVYFKYPGIGICTFSHKQVQAMMFPKQITTTDVNNHPTNKRVHGNKKGYLYIVSWAQETPEFVISNKLECASMIQDSNQLASMIKIAKELDKLA